MTGIRQPVGTRQHNVEQDQLRQERANGLQRRFARTNHLHAVALSLQVELQQLLNGGLVFDHKYPFFCHGHNLSYFGAFCGSSLFVLEPPTLAA